MAHLIRPRQRRFDGGFTLIELLVVIGILVVLMTILVPVASRVRRAAQVANTQQVIGEISRAIELYIAEFRSAPGPIPDTDIMVYRSTSPTLAVVSAAPGFEISDPTFPQQITMSENLVLGLLGALRVDTNSPTPTLEYDPSLVGSGANSLMNLQPGMKNAPAKRSQPFIDGSKNLSWRVENAKKTGHFVDDVGVANDTIIPEFVDTFPSPLPILYLRAHKGAAASPTYDGRNNTIVTYDAATPSNRVGQYDLHQIIGYTGTKIGAGAEPAEFKNWADSISSPHGLRPDNNDVVEVKSTLLSNAPTGLIYKYPYDAYAYLRNSALSGPQDPDPNTPRNDVPQQKDGYILISAGPDRTYGTSDDITNFGPVGQ